MIGTVVERMTAPWWLVHFVRHQIRCRRQLREQLAVSTAARPAAGPTDPRSAP